MNRRNLSETLPIITVEQQTRRTPHFLRASLGVLLRISVVVLVEIVKLLFILWEHLLEAANILLVITLDNNRLLLVHDSQLLLVEFRAIQLLDGSINMRKGVKNGRRIAGARGGLDTGLLQRRIEQLREVTKSVVDVEGRMNQNRAWAGELNKGGGLLTLQIRRRSCWDRHQRRLRKECDHCQAVRERQDEILVTLEAMVHLIRRGPHQLTPRVNLLARHLRALRARALGGRGNGNEIIQKAKANRQTLIGQNAVAKLVLSSHQLDETDTGLIGARRVLLLQQRILGNKVLCNILKSGGQVRWPGETEANGVSSTNSLQNSRPIGDLSLAGKFAELIGEHGINK